MRITSRVKWALAVVAGLWWIAAGIAAPSVAGLGRSMVAVTLWIGLVAMLPMLVRATRGFRPPRLPWPAVPLAHLPVALAFSVGQAIVTAGLRLIVARVQGLAIEPLAGGAGRTILLAARLDIILYAVAVAVLLAAARGDDQA